MTGVMILPFAADHMRTGLVTDALAEWRTEISPAA
ncbi:hypothetical protein SBI_08373 [Streptomyces bingchenggensis BCW-1]|uniref:Uncharacterized protein n=1 Tax=Streptomyces bingchenggensis (strain BCW-1) TaxID=749414 RepID=D7BSJ4_STRBB|nr:hypothetical protein SBI_08373 [Streptomyces bingchenggensis BCW-1]